MKSKDVQSIVLSKYKNGESATVIFNHLNGAISLRTIERWCKTIRDTGSISLSYSPGHPRVARTKNIIQRVKGRMNRKKRISARKLANELDVSERSMRRILKDDLGLRSYKKRIEPLLTDIHKTKRLAFANWIHNNFRKKQTMKILFADECIWDEFVQQMNWDKVQSKKTLINELKRGVKRIKYEVVLESCVKWTNRLYHLSKNNGDYLH